jgi:hypothetical protein
MSAVEYPLAPRSGTSQSIVRACRDALMRRAQPYDLASMEVVGNGKPRRVEGRTIAPLDVRVIYRSRGVQDVKSSTVRCEMDRAGACHRDDLILAWFSSPTRASHVSASGQEAVEALHAAQAPFSLVRSCVFRGWPSAGPLLPTYSPDHGWLPGGHALASRPNGWGALGSAAYLVVSEWMLPLLPRAGAGARRLCAANGAAAWGWFVSRRARFPVWSTEARGSPACSQRA